MIYVLGAPTNASCFKVDIYCNFECLPNPEFLNYLPLTMSPKGISNEEKSECNTIIQKKPISKGNERNIQIDEEMPSIWYKLKKKFKNGFPSFKKLLSNGILNQLPFYKGGLSIAGAMIETQMDQD